MPDCLRSQLAAGNTAWRAASIPTVRAFKAANRNVATQEEIATVIREMADEFFPGRLAPDVKAITVTTLVNAIRGEFGHGLPEADVEAAVKAIGGHREHVLDPWGAPGRWLAKLAKEPAETPDIFEVPVAFLEQRAPDCTLADPDPTLADL